MLVTGHTGFKGAWLCEWLLALGADVHGLALAPDSNPALFDRLGLASRMHHRLADVRDLMAVQNIVNEVRPDFVFHLAAQALVRQSYREPVETFDTNLMGTVHLLEALRQSGAPVTAVCVTTDKCYENCAEQRAFRESDPLGGHDPYSASKAAGEIAIAAYRDSFFSAPDSPVRVASARAGNVIGGGDWAEDRIVPDCMRALAAGLPIAVRNPSATRPWQHVLEPLSGYLWLAARLREERSLAGAYNFGPTPESNQTVRVLVEEILRHRPGAWCDASEPGAVYEAKFLSLDIGKAAQLLQWHPVWDFARGVAETTRWYADASVENAVLLTTDQIRSYTRDARAAGREWAA